MARFSGGFWAILLGVVVSACGGKTAPSKPDGSPSGGSMSGGAGSAGARATGETGGTGGTGGAGGAGGAGGTSTQDGGASPDAGTDSPQGTGGTVPKHCPSKDGQSAYGPIGDPHLLPIKSTNFDFWDECTPCGTLRTVSGFPVGSGFGFVWDTDSDSASPRWSLNSMITDSNFGAGEPRSLLTRDAALKLDVVSSRGGFVATTCSEGATSEWIPMNGDLEVPGGAGRIAPEVPCDRYFPNVFWTGEAYLTAFGDARGLVLAVLDEQGATVREDVLSEEFADPRMVRFSRNGDRVLLGLTRISMGQARYGVLDLKGALIGELHAIGEAKANPTLIAISPSDDGWLVVTDYAVTNVEGVRFTQISRAGLISRERQMWSNFPRILVLTPSAYGGVLYVGISRTPGQYGNLSCRIARLDSELEPVYAEERARRDDVRPFAVIRDANRDLVIQFTPEGTISVQEYGCLN